jgi:MoxR-like ATPase
MTDITEKLMKAMKQSKGETLYDADPLYDDTVAPKPVPERKVIELVETDWESDGVGGERQAVKISSVIGPLEHIPDALINRYRGYECPDIDKFITFMPDRYNLEWSMFGLAHGLTQMLVGVTGAGKTELPEFIGALLGRPFLRIDNSEELDRAQVMGMTHIVDGETKFVPGDMPTYAAWPTLTLADEVARGTAAANISTYKRVLDRRVIYLPEMKEADQKEIIPHPDWSFWGSDNTKGDGEDLHKYGASNVQDAAFRNAFGQMIEFDYLTYDEECKLIRAFCPDMHGEEVNKLARFSELMHKAFREDQINTAFSPRQLKNICKFYDAGVPLKQAIERVYISFVSKSELADVSESLRAVFG